LRLKLNCIIANGIGTFENGASNPKAIIFLVHIVGTKGEGSRRLGEDVLVRLIEQGNEAPLGI